MSSAAVRSNPTHLASVPFIRKAGGLDVPRLASGMREEDRQEVWHSSRKSPLQALLQGCRAGPCWAVERAGDVVAMFGVVGVAGQIGAPWMLASDDLKAIRKTFLRECRPVVDGWTAEYSYLTNAVWSKNTTHIEWLRWLGFQFEGSDIRNGETFLHFHRRKQCVSPQRS